MMSLMISIEYDTCSDATYPTRLTFVLVLWVLLTSVLKTLVKNN